MRCKHKGPLDNYSRRMIISAIWNEKDISAYKIKKLIKSEITLATIIGHLNVLIEYRLIARIRNDRGAQKRYLYTLTEEGKKQFINDWKQEIRSALNSPFESDFRKIFLEIYGKQPEECYDL